MQRPSWDINCRCAAFQITFLEIHRFLQKSLEARGLYMATLFPFSVSKGNKGSLWRQGFALSPHEAGQCV